MLQPHSMLSITLPSLRSRLFAALILPVFSYACQVWGVPFFSRSNPLDNPLDQLQLHFLRMMAGVAGSTHRLSLLHEFGHTPISHHFVKLAARFWDRATALPETQILHRSLLSDLQLMLNGCKHCWSYYFLTAMHNLDLGPSPDFIVNATDCLTMSFPETAVVPRFAARAFAYCTPRLPPADLPRCPRTCASNSVRGFTFRFWVGMTAASPAPHLRHWMPPPLRIALCRLRLSMSDLRVDRGRHARPRVPRQQRLCMAHSTLDPHDAVEDIRHFLLECPAYDRIRSSNSYSILFTPTEGLPLTCAQHLRCIFSHSNQYLLASCISRMLELRAHILSAAPDTPPALLAFMPGPNHILTEWWLQGTTDNPHSDLY